MTTPQEINDTSVNDGGHCLFFTSVDDEEVINKELVTNSLFIYLKFTDCSRKIDFHFLLVCNKERT